MFRTASLLALGLIGALSGAMASPIWIGMTPSVDDVTQVQLFYLNSDGSRANDIGVIQVGAKERVAVDSFRCMPYGYFCVLSTFDGTDSRLYNVTVGSGSGLRGLAPTVTTVPGVLVHNLHMDHTTGGIYTFALKPGSSESSAVVVGVVNQEVTQYLDISSYVGPDDRIPPGGSTQCSDTNSVWVGVKKASGSDILIQVSLPHRSVTKVTTLQQPLWASLWASCDNSDDVNNVGGIMMLAGGADVGYSDLAANGSYALVNQATVPQNSPPLVLSGLLSEPIGFDYFFTLYPNQTEPGSDTSGWIGFGNFDISPLSMNPISYYLTGAARTH